MIDTFMHMLKELCNAQSVIEFYLNSLKLQNDYQLTRWHELTTKVYQSLSYATLIVVMSSQSSFSLQAATGITSPSIKYQFPVYYHINTQYQSWVHWSHFLLLEQTSHTAAYMHIHSETDVQYLHNNVLKRLALQVEPYQPRVTKYAYMWSFRSFNYYYSFKTLIWQYTFWRRHNVSCMNSSEWKMML